MRKEQIRAEQKMVGKAVSGFLSIGTLISSMMLIVRVHVFSIPKYEFWVGLEIVELLMVAYTPI